MEKVKGFLKVLLVMLGMAIAAGSLHALGFGTKTEVQEINGVPTNVAIYK